MTSRPSDTPETGDEYAPIRSTWTVRPARRGGRPVSAIEPGSRWVAKDGSREVVVEYWSVWSSRGDVRNVATGRVFSISQPTLLAKYRRVEQGADR